MEPLPSIKKIYSMAIQEESNNIFLLPKLESSSQIEESNTLINANDARKFQDRGKNHVLWGYKKDLKISHTTIKLVTL